MNNSKSEQKKYPDNTSSVSLLGLVDTIADIDFNSGCGNSALSEKVETVNDKTPKKHSRRAVADNMSDYDYLLKQASVLKAKGWHKGETRTVSNVPIRDDIRVMLMKLKTRPEFRGFSMGDLLSAAWLLFLEHNKDLAVFKDLIDDLNSIKSE